MALITLVRLEKAGQPWNAGRLQNRTDGIVGSHFDHNLEQSPGVSLLQPLPHSFQSPLEILVWLLLYWNSSSTDEDLLLAKMPGPSRPALRFAAPPWFLPHGGGA